MSHRLLSALALPVGAALALGIPTGHAGGQAVSRNAPQGTASQGNFSGEHHTTVLNTQKPIKPSPLVGSQHLGEDGQCTFGFTINWKFSDSTAIFVSQCFAGAGGEEVLQTIWLLREKVDSLPSNWKAIRTGCNVFTRMG
ncbi:avidin-like [Aptenodytes patagonicus]|uniref:avidin-like n=1 Tax=Aptenodytes patagonicus TaxID=9234 RepID=UPI003FA11D5F